MHSGTSDWNDPVISAPVVQVPASAPSVDVIEYGGTIEPIEAASMLIDCDFMQYTHQGAHQTSVKNP